MSIDRRRFVAATVALGLMPRTQADAATPSATATAVTKVFGDGQKLVAVSLDLGEPVDGTAMAAGDFAVAGRRVVAAYASDAPGPGRPVAAGRFAIVELSADDPDAALLVHPAPAHPPGGDANGPGDRPPPDLPAPILRPAVADLTRIGQLRAASGAAIRAPAVPLRTSAVRNLVVDDFRQFVFDDPATGTSLRYNLFAPAAIEAGRTYPLVLFMHDAGNTSPDPRVTLCQGLGAVAFASPADQADRPCFVLAPQYDAQVVNDRSEATSALDATVNLVEHVASTHPVDRSRLYATGQSGGCMLAIAMNIKHPDLFAASFLVAGQWNAGLVTPMARSRLWIVVSEGDLKAFPGQSAIAAALEAAGARVARAEWDGRADPAGFAAAVAALEGQGAPINYAALRRGTVVPPGQPDDGGANHVNTWRIAYDIPGIRAWLFQQTR